MLFNWNLNNADTHTGYVEICDQIYASRVNKVVQNILYHKDLRILTIAGPSSSGKTTTALKLCKLLKENGRLSKVVSMDNFYKNSKDIPVKNDGKPDFEALDALDTDLLFKCLRELIHDGETGMPVFNFHKGRREEQPELLKLGNEDVIIIEGIHGLNPHILNGMPECDHRSLYISVDERVFLENGMVFSKRDIRLLRRLVRDYKYRGASPELTFSMWNSVREGEDLYIFPYQNNADMTINSFHDYELFVIKRQAEEILSQVPADSAYRGKADELFSKLRILPCIDEKYVPGTSLIREFIGDSDYYSQTT